MNVLFMSCHGYTSPKRRQPMDVISRFLQETRQ